MRRRKNTPNDNEKLRAAYERHVVRRDGCWGWNGPKNIYGYGRIFVSGHSVKSAHRASYTLHVGEIPVGMMVLHSCDNTSCTNPGHLRIGTQKDNMRDAVDRGRMVFYHMPGSANGRAKMREDDVLRIRELYDAGSLKAKQEAARLGVSNVAVLLAAKRKTWRHV